MTRLVLDLRFEPRDLWVGVFWDQRPNGLHVYVCVVPCLVLHLIVKPRAARRERES